MRNTFIFIAVLSIFLVVGLGLIIFSEDSDTGKQKANTDAATTTTAVTNSQKQTVDLYYYRPQSDIDSRGVLQCSEAGLTPVKRKLSVSESVVEDTVAMLLQGDLRHSERRSGIITEFPLSDVRMIGVLVRDGTAIIALDDPHGWTSGGSCRANVLRSQVQRTALQFPSVSEVRFLPDTLFQP